MKRPIFSDHGLEITLLGLIAAGIIYLAGQAIAAENAGEASAWTAVLMAIIGAIKDRWSARSIDRMGEQLGTSTPKTDGPMPVQVVNPPADPVSVEPTKA